jgi:hypothetical protein
MADRRDDLDSWLNGRVDPLPPPPGTFELIQRRARRRKYRRLAITAGAAAVIVAAAVTVPQVVNLPVLGPAAPEAPAGHSASVSPTGGGSLSSSSATHVPPPGPAPVPANFRPSSVTFVGTDTGFVIGQAGTPGHCATQYCTSVARTDNAGKSWTGVPAPLTGAPAGATGVGQVRFLNTDDGWAFGPELFATHDGGHTWTRVDTHGLRVTDVETVGDRAFGVFATCSGTGPAFAAQCTSFTLYSSPASADDWTPVGGPTTGLTDGGQAGAASLVLTGTRGYLLGPDGMLYAGPIAGNAAWQPVARIPCSVGKAQQDGQPAGALLGAMTATDLVFACTSPPVAGGLQKKLIFTSADGGASWQQTAVAPAAGIATSVAASPAETWILGTNQGIDVLPAGSTAWQQATMKGAGEAGGAPAGGFSFVGMTTDEQGIALPADATVGTVWFTFNGGQSWQPSSVSGS